MNKSTKIFISIAGAIIIFALLYVMMGEIAWQYLEIEGKPPINAWWLLFTHESAKAKQVAMMTLLLPAIVIIALPIMAVLGYFQKKKRWVYGRARLANIFDIRKAGLIQDKKKQEGIFLGFFKDKILYENSDEHVMLVADTRTGKGVSILIPTLLTWSKSLIVHDPKGELWDITAFFRKLCGYQVYKFAPFDENGKTHRFNPFFYVSDKNPLDYIQKLSHFLWPTPTTGDPMWSGAARVMFQGLCLYVYETEGKDSLTFAKVLRFGTRNDLANFLLQEVQTANLSETCKSLLEDFAGTTERTRSGIVKQFTSALEIFQNPFVEAATNGNDFDLRKFREKKTALYISGGNGIANLQRMSLLNRIISQTALLANTEETPEENTKYKYKLLMVLDEMFHMGYMKDLSNNITLAAGYGVKFLTVWQNEGQIYELYGKDAAETFISNHKTRIYYLPDDDHTQALCEKIGFTTIKVYSGQKGKGSRDYTLQKRELFTKDVLKSKMGTDKAIIFSRGCHPILAKKAVYHSDRRFLARIVEKHNIRKAIASKSMEDLKPLIIPPPELPTQTLDKTATKNVIEAREDEKLAAIAPPKDASIEEIDRYIDDHAKAILHEEANSIF